MSKVFATIRPRKRINVDVLGRVVEQMQGLVDTDYPNASEEVLAFQQLVARWHAMLQEALVDEVKRA